MKRACGRHLAWSPARVALTWITAHQIDVL
jgi:hypothetical protein